MSDSHTSDSDSSEEEIPEVPILNSESDNSEDETLQGVLEDDDNEIGLMPYLFEPERSDDSLTGSDEESDSSIEPEVNRVGNLNWCTCKNCKKMTRNIDCFCCHEIADNFKEQKMEGIDCVTENQTFQWMCLNKDILNNVLVCLHETRGDKFDKNPSLESLRYAGYRQFNWWLYSYLGRGNRKVLPSCTLWKIRERFPDPNGEYKLYMPSSEYT